MSTRRLMASIIALAAGLAVAGMVLAAKGPNPYRGRTLFKSTCKLCHHKGGEAANLTPMSKTQAQWEGFFKNRSTPCVKRVETKTQKTLNETDLADMKLFLVSHAADSDQPETCGE
ncbi:MAG TPA: cytochrome c [Candidatus Polarisedimenticolia bacterium]|nr:cytochrome c [Candidatus Polarisedimenticolia bacterium]